MSLIRKWQLIDAFLLSDICSNQGYHVTSFLTPTCNNSCSMAVLAPKARCGSTGQGTPQTDPTQSDSIAESDYNSLVQVSLGTYTVE